MNLPNIADAVEQQQEFEAELCRMVAAYCPSKIDRWQAAYTLRRVSDLCRRTRREPELTRDVQAEEAGRRG